MSKIDPDMLTRMLSTANAAIQCVEEGTPSAIEGARLALLDLRDYIAACA